MAGRYDTNTKARAARLVRELMSYARGGQSMADAVLG